MNIWLDGINQEKINKSNSEYKKLQKKLQKKVAKKSKTKKSTKNGKINK